MDMRAASVGTVRLERRGWGFAERWIGDGRAGNPSRPTFPTTAFFDILTSGSAPILAVDSPVGHNSRRRAT
jgi:hypothetical protein